MIGGGTVPEPTQIFGVIAVIIAQRLATTENDGWAFVASGFGIAAALGQLFIALYPNVMVSSTNHAYNLTVNNSAAGHYGAGRDDRRRGAVLPDRAALPGLVVPRVPPAGERTAHVIRLGSDARPGPAPAPAHQAGAAPAGGRLGARDRDRADRAARATDALADRRASIRRHVAVRSLARVRLLVVAFAARGAFAWAMEFSGRRAAWSVLSELRLALIDKRPRHAASAQVADLAGPHQRIERVEGFLDRARRSPSDGSGRGRCNPSAGA